MMGEVGIAAKTNRGSYHNDGSFFFLFMVIHKEEYMDQRFNRLYIFRVKEGELNRLQQICEDYHINDNGIFEYASKKHIIYGVNEDGLIYLSQVMALRGIDFNSLDEFEEYLSQFTEKN